MKSFNSIYFDHLFEIINIKSNNKIIAYHFNGYSDAKKRWSQKETEDLTHNLQNWNYNFGQERSKISRDVNPDEICEINKMYGKGFYATLELPSGGAGGTVSDYGNILNEVEIDISDFVITAKNLYDELHVQTEENYITQQLKRFDLPETFWIYYNTFLEKENQEKKLNKYDTKTSQKYDEIYDEHENESKFKEKYKLDNLGKEWEKLLDYMENLGYKVSNYRNHVCSPSDVIWYNKKDELECYYKCIEIIDNDPIMKEFYDKEKEINSIIYSKDFDKKIPKLEKPEKPMSIIKEEQLNQLYTEAVYLTLRKIYKGQYHKSPIKGIIYDMLDDQNGVVCYDPPKTVKILNKIEFKSLKQYEKFKQLR